MNPTDINAENEGLPDSIPVMILDGATLFPCGYLPLFISESHHRMMLEAALEGERMFCVTSPRIGNDASALYHELSTITTIGLIRACVTHEDGSSHLMLSGIKRAEIVKWEQWAPFPIARINPRPCRLEDVDQALDAVDELIELSEQLCEQGLPVSHSLRERLRQATDPSMVADVVGHCVVTDSRQRQNLLEMDGVVEKLNFLTAHLVTLLGKS